MKLSDVIGGGAFTTTTPTTHKPEGAGTVVSVVSVDVVNAKDGIPASNLWRIHYEPFTPAVRRPSTPLTAKEEAAILAWLAHIDETTPEGIDDVLTGCRDDADCRGYYLERSKEVRAMPGMVSCGECQHFRRFDYHPHLGHCALGEPMAAAGIWDADVRWCRVFQSNEVTQ